MRKMKMTSRDKVLLVLLLLILIAASYYWFYYKPSMEKLQQLDIDISEKQSEVLLAQARQRQMNDMTAELDAIFEAADGEPTEICEYNNINNVLNELQEIFYGLDFEMRLAEPLFDETSTIVRRNISVSFETPGFEDAYNMLEKLHSSVYRCLIKDMTLRSNHRSGEERYSISTDITYFEYNT